MGRSGGSLVGEQPPSPEKTARLRDGFETFLNGFDALLKGNGKTGRARQEKATSLCPPFLD